MMFLFTAEDVYLRGAHEAGLKKILFIPTKNFMLVPLF